MEQQQQVSKAEADEIAIELMGPVFRSLLDRIGDRWSVLVLLEMREGARRFNELHRSLPGISRRMLTFTLRNLERDGLIRREVSPTVPPKVEYSQTPVAAELRQTLEVLRHWAMRNRGLVMEARAAFDERESDRESERKSEPEPRKAQYPAAPRQVTSESRQAVAAFRGRVPSTSRDRLVNGLGPVPGAATSAARPAPRKVLRAF